MRRRVVPVCALAVMITACTDPHVAPSAPTSARPLAEVVPVDPGEDTRQVSDVTWEFSGGYDGFDRADAYRSQTFHLEQVVSGAQLYTWATFPTPISVFGGPAPVDVDSASTTPASGPAVTVRAAGPLVFPDSATLVSSFGWGAAPPAAPTARVTGATAALRTNASAPPGGRRARSRVGRFATPATAARDLAELRSRARGEQRVDAHTLRFDFGVGPSTQQIDFDDRVGAPVAIRSFEGGRPTASITQEWQPARGGQVLTSRSIVVYDDSGQPRERFKETFATP